MSVAANTRAHVFSTLAFLFVGSCAGGPRARIAEPQPSSAHREGMRDENITGCAVAHIGGRLLVTQSSGSLRLGDTCRVSGESLGPPNCDRFHLTVRCEIGIVYAGLVTVDDSDPRVLARDPFRVEVDGTPRFQWELSSATLDGPSLSATFEVLRASPSTGYP